MSNELYDTTPAATTSLGGSHRIACLFHTRGDAERAAEDLEAIGFSRGNIQIVDQTPTTTPGATDNNGGLWESIKSLFSGDDAHGYYEGVGRGQTLLTVTAATEAQAEEAATILDRHDPVDVDAQEESWRQTGWTPGSRTDIGSTATDPTLAGTPIAGGLTPKPAAPSSALSEVEMAGRATSPLPATAQTGDQVIPVVQEDLAIGKRTVTRGGLRVRTYVVETPVEEDVRLRDERVQVNRRPVDRAAPVGEDAFRERSVEMTETTEEAVISKTARVVEEVEIRKEVGERTEHVSDTTRRTEVEIEDDRANPTRPV